MTRYIFDNNIAFHFSGVVLVTTPQQASLQVVRRGITMLKKLNVPIVGIVQNMSNIICPSCNKNVSLFGNGTKQLADENGMLSNILSCLLKRFSSIISRWVG